MSVTTDQVDKLADAAMGCTEYVMAYSRAGTWGMIKEVFAMRSAAGDVSHGPGHELISATRKHLSDRSDSGPTIDAEDKDALRADGQRLVESALPTVAQLPPDVAEQVRAWLIGIAEKVAGASKDKGGSEKVSDAEAAAIEDLRRLLHA
ncbi:hypothetical protein [Isoptericola aurantiacus]|uniref:hypothetical protein n=1 Tax=Isoptericola aurantiacus TaxID=3377839 RepID=UPI00383BA2B1